MEIGFSRRLSLRAGIYLALSTMILLPRPATGQSVYGTITGSITDSTHAAVVNARVSAVNPATRFTRETLSNSTGVYTLPNLLPGAYTVSVPHPALNAIPAPAST